MTHRVPIMLLATVAAVLALSTTALCSHVGDLQKELDTLVDDGDQAMLFAEIERIQPAWSIRRLVSFDNAQWVMGGGMDDRIPAQLAADEELPMPFDRQGVLEVAVTLARQRQVSRDALGELGFPLAFAEGPPIVDVSHRSSALYLTFDLEVPRAFLEGLDDGVITAEEAAAIVALPGNRELLQYQGKAPHTTPRLTPEGLVYFVERAGSADPLDLLWCWLNPLNNVGYADLVTHATEYRSFLNAVESHEQKLCDAVAARIGPFLPPDFELEESVALTVGGPDPIWATPDMAGVNIGFARGDWERLVQLSSKAVCRRLQLRLCRTRSGHEADTVEDLAVCCPEDSRYDDLHRLLAFAVLDGTADYAASGSIGPSDSAEVERGADLLERYVAQVVDDAETGPGEGFLREGLASGSPLPALGRRMASIVADSDGRRAVFELLQEGAVTLVQRALEIESAKGNDLLSADVRAALYAVLARLQRGTATPGRVSSRGSYCGAGYAAPGGMCVDPFDQRMSSVFESFVSQESS